MRTESRTPPRADNSASIASFLRCSSANESCFEFPFVAGADVGPDGTVGACKLSILNGRPISRMIMLAAEQA